MRRGCRGRERESYRLVLPREREREQALYVIFYLAPAWRIKRGSRSGKGLENYTRLITASSICTVLMLVRYLSAEVKIYNCICRYTRAVK